MSASYEKAGRLKPDSGGDVVRVIIEGVDDVCIITRRKMEAMALFAGEEPMIEIPIEDRVYLAYTWQVRNLLEKWPWKKAGVWRGE